MDDIDETLATAASDPTAHPAIRAAAAVGTSMLNKYYSLSDCSESYRIAVILHPQHKFKYFKDVKWLDEWIQNAQMLVRTIFDEEYAHWNLLNQTPDGIQIVHAPPSPEAPGLDDDQYVNAFKKCKRDGSQNVFAEADAPPIDELTRYLAVPPMDTKRGFNVIQWWYDQRYEHPRLSRMALGYLSIPPTSVDVERLFSQGRLVLSHLRNRLLVESIRALLCLGEWSIRGLIHVSAGILFQSCRPMTLQLLLALRLLQRARTE